MSTSKTESQKIREIEASVLDQAHQSQSLLNRHQSQAVGHLLKLYGGLHRDSEHFLKLPLTTSKQHFNYFRMALEHCLRWTIAECPTGNETQTASFEVLDKEALELFSWGLEYSRIASDHVAWSRGELKATINESSKKIHFSLTHEDHSILIGQHTHDVLRGDEFRNEVPQDSLNQFFESWRTGFKMGAPPKIPDLEQEQFAALVDEIIPVSEILIFPELDGSEQIAAFSLNEFRRFYIALYANCWMYSELESYCDQTIGRENDLGSLILQTNEDDLLDYLVNISELSAPTVKAIVNLLTFDASFNATLTAQPFVKSNCGSLALLTRLFTHLLPQDMLARALIRSKSNVYDKLIDKIERQNVASIEANLRDAGLYVRSQLRFDQEDQKVTPDLLLYDENPNLLVVADYKHSMTPVGPAEVSNRIKDHAKNIEQMKRYLDFFTKFPETLEPIFGTKASSARIVALLLYRSPMPIPVKSDPLVLVADWTTFSTWISFTCEITNEHGFNLERAVRSYVDASQFSSNSLDWVVETIETNVGDWTYVHEQFVSPRETDNFNSGE